MWPSSATTACSRKNARDRSIRADSQGDGPASSRDGQGGCRAPEAGTDVVLAMMKKDVRLTVPAAKAAGIPSVVRMRMTGRSGAGSTIVCFLECCPVITSSTRKRHGKRCWVSVDRPRTSRSSIMESIPLIRDRESVELGVLMVRSPSALWRLEVRKISVDLAHAWKIVSGSCRRHGSSSRERSDVNARCWLTRRA